MDTIDATELKTNLGDVLARAAVDPRLPFAIVYYSEAGVVKTEGLRLDLDKQVFLDHFKDARSEELASAAAPEIINFLGTRAEGASAAHTY